MERVKQYFIKRDAAFLIDRIREFSESSATVELAAERLQCQPAHIAKSISLFVKIPKTKAELKALQKQQSNKNKEGEGSPTTSSPSGSPTGTAGDNGYPVLIVAAGDAKINTAKFKAKFNSQPRMIKREDVEREIGYAAGGVCPFDVLPSVKVYTDVSLKRFETVYPACGTANSGIPLTPDELYQYSSNVVEWVDVCEGWGDNDVPNNKEEEEEK